MFMTSGTLISPSSLTAMEARSWREPEICLNKLWTDVLPSLPKVSTFFAVKAFVHST